MAIQINPAKTALVLIDLQKGIVCMPLAPCSGGDIVRSAQRATRQFRTMGASVVLVTVSWSPDFMDAPRQLVDKPLAGDGALPADWSQIVDGLAEPGDVRITKRQWGAFYGTELDLQLRRRGIDTIVLGGVATNYGVESTARAAWEHGYQLILAEDLIASFSPDLHAFSLENVLCHIGRIVPISDIQFDK